jgi:hypothetical protein
MALILAGFKSGQTGILSQTELALKAWQQM